MVEIVFGVNIVEIVTKGLYPDSRDIIREYIQNSCDAIDKAIDAGILSEGDGKITIDIDAAKRRITIEDNGTGISSARDFVRIMSNIGNSDKTLQTDRGFRGIGRLGGLAYCKTLIFSTKVAGEKKISTLTINAEKLREAFFHKKKYLAEQVLSANMFFDTIDDDDTDAHFFRVELIDILDTNSSLLNVEKVCDYLAFVAPVTYSPIFYYQTEIYNHAAALNFKITEYKIEINNEQLVKPYKTEFTTQSGEDKIFGIAFRDFYDDNGNLIAWSWIGLSTFKGIIKKIKANKMRCIRLRTGNIQIGDEDVFKNLFKEDRGTTYFIGEVHTVDKKLRPNTRRDYFEEDAACNALERELKKYFIELNDLYHDASKVRGYCNAINAPVEFERKFNEQSAPYRKSHEAEHIIELSKKKEAAENDEKKLSSIKQEAEQNPDTPLSCVVLRIMENQSVQPPCQSLPTTQETKPKFPPSRWTRKQRDVYWAIESIIIDNPKLAGDSLVNKIKTELAK